MRNAANITSVIVVGVLLGFVPPPTQAQTVAGPNGAPYICTQQGLQTPDGRAVIVAQQGANVPTTQTGRLEIQQPNGTAVVSQNPASQCLPIMCPAGPTYPTCTPEGYPINYFANPCQVPPGPQNPVTVAGQTFTGQNNPAPQTLPPAGNPNLYYVPPGQPAIPNPSLYYVPPGQITSPISSFNTIPAGQFIPGSQHITAATNVLRQTSVLYHVPPGTRDPLFYGGAVAPIQVGQ